ncbi:MAG TPA: phosphoribosylaminoimidazolesuccinocarboxamide synthase [Chloroflexota bacterium]
MIVRDVLYGPTIAEGKTKVLYAVPDDVTGYALPASELAYMVHKDAITAGDGAKRDVIAGKGALSCRTTSAVFRYLDQHGVETHAIDTLDERTMLVRRAEMIPIEWVARRIATGSYIRRTGIAEGTRFDPPVLELFYKDDAQHDPLITGEEAIAMGLCTRSEIETGLALTERVFTLLEQAWDAQDVQLVDLKIELGRTPDGIVLADVIDNDSWRLWPGGERGRMLDKQVYRDLRGSDAQALEDVRRRYVEVAERAEQFASAQPL